MAATLEGLQSVSDCESQSTPNRQFPKGICPLANEYQLVRIADARGQMHEFQVFPFGTPFVERPGLYVFCAPIAQGNWNALYVGQTHDLQARVGAGLSTHHQYLSAIIAGATHTAVELFPGPEAQRLAAEKELISALSPRLNGTGVGRNALFGFNR